MNEREHVLNGLLLGMGIGYLLEPGSTLESYASVVAVSIPVLLGTFFPDVDGYWGDHRKTFHNLLTLGVFVAFPFVFGTLEWVWVGIATHYTLDVLGTTRGIALFYPLSNTEYELPVGVTVDSPFATVVTLLVTLFELLVVTALSLGWDVIGQLIL